MLAKTILILGAVCVASACTDKPTPPPSTDDLFISAFNVQVFGKSKMSKPEVVDILVQIIMRYDLVVIQEIRDIDEVAFPQLMEAVNAAASDVYAGFMSPRSGRTSSQEQYGFIYKVNRLDPIYQYEYNDDNNDIFEREPYIVQFHRLTEGEQKFFNYIILHAKPDDAIDEMNGLVTVYDQSITTTGLEDAFIGGDLNADCNYVCNSCWSAVTLRTDPRFTWMTPDDADTTVSTTDCAYDRIITTGEMTLNTYGAAVFDFEKYYGLSNSLAKDVSDHYPVEFYVG